MRYRGIYPAWELLQKLLKLNRLNLRLYVNLLVCTQLSRILLSAGPMGNNLISGYYSVLKGYKMGSKIIPCHIYWELDMRLLQHLDSGPHYYGKLVQGSINKTRKHEQGWAKICEMVLYFNFFQPFPFFHRAIMEIIHYPK